VAAATLSGYQRSHSVRTASSESTDYRAADRSRGCYGCRQRRADVPGVAGSRTRL